MRTRSFQVAPWARVVAAAGSMAIAGTALAGGVGGNPFITADEDGHGTITFPGAQPFTMPSFVGQDPGPGGLPNALIYNLAGPPNLVSGDVLILDSDGTLSDLIRFFQDPTGSFFAFYSDLPEPGETPPLADTGLPGAFFPNHVTFTEHLLPDGSMGLLYTPGPNDPGYVGGFAVTYTFISDAVPAPSAAGLLALGGVAAFRRRR